MRLLLSLILFFLTSPLYASPWEFGQAINVSRVHGAKTFHHMPSAGRQHIATSGKYVAVVWEDNRDGVSRSYVALKSLSAQSFSTEYRISTEDEAFDPAIVRLRGGYFAVTWESTGKVWARLVGPHGIGKPVELSSQESKQASLGFGPASGLLATWSERDGQYFRIKVAKLNFDLKSEKLKVSISYNVDNMPQRGDQLYPSMAVLDGKALTVAWEDRREGHTLILYGHSADGMKFDQSMQLNEARTGNVQGLGRGTGAIRVAVSGMGKQGAVAIWSDKRDFLSGYDVYAAFASANGAQFGENQKVQDSFGDNIVQWHPAIAANEAGQVAAVWDDDRDGTSDIWLAWPLESEWSDNVAIPGASGPGVQVEPAIAMDAQGNVHVAWVDKSDLNAPSRVRYVMGRYARVP